MFSLRPALSRQIPPPVPLGFTRFQRHWKATILSFSTTQGSSKSP
ncbi:putative methylmalonate-semialdehyde dehydrogenase [acylating] [Venturia inaequalis]|nr:putative methylmalonate-semialdehyde dehydrogenase [acylating] [Venturia inaequalis]